MTNEEETKLRRALVEALRPHTMVSIRLSDLWHLTRSALQHEEISMSRAAELLGVKVCEMRDIALVLDGPR